MINIYAFTYPSAMRKFDGYILVKIGDSHRDAEVRIAEQGGSAEWEAKIQIGVWPNLEKIHRDYDVHTVLQKQGLHYKDGSGTEWFKIPSSTKEEAFKYIDDVITSLEGKKSRKSVKLRKLQQRALDQVMEIIEKGQASASIIANLCPRFGKTLWALSLFNNISEKYGNRIMLLPAYWLSVHTSFKKTANKYLEFSDIIVIDAKVEDAEEQVNAALSNGFRVVIELSLHGDLAGWKTKNGWMQQFDNNDVFVFADEGDFGTHTVNQVEKLNFLFDK